MSIKTVLFDLDGTLLTMDQDEFIKTYFKYLSGYLAAHNYEPKKLFQVFGDGVNAMRENDGSKTNEEVFWREFVEAYGEEAKKDKSFIDEFYRSEFNKVQSVSVRNEQAKEIVTLVKEKGKMTVLATNPMFPHTATENRIRWAGLVPEDFTEYTTYEDCHYCKPNLKYYEQLLWKLQLKPEECIMVGNDVEEDMEPAKQLGMKRFLLTNCLINKYGKDISDQEHGDFEELKRYLNEML